jgi:hypothetical protein
MCHSPRGGTDVALAAGRERGAAAAREAPRGQGPARAPHLRQTQRVDPPAGLHVRVLQPRRDCEGLVGVAYLRPGAVRRGRDAGRRRCLGRRRRRLTAEPLWRFNCNLDKAGAQLGGRQAREGHVDGFDSVGATKRAARRGRVSRWWCVMVWCGVVCGDGRDRSWRRGTALCSHARPHSWLPAPGPTHQPERLDVAPSIGLQTAAW